MPVIFMVLIIGLATMGVGYASWSQTLYINGEVHTGTFSIGFTHAESDDPAEEECNPGEIGDPDRIDPGYGKNVAGCWVELLDPKGTHGDDIIYEKIRVVVCNAYPSYTNTIDFSLDNGGSIPAIVGSAEIVKIAGVELLDPIELPKNVPINVDLNGDGEGDVDITFSYEGEEPQQIDPCEELWYDLEMHFKDGVDPDTGEPVGLPMDEELTFEIEIETIQWNLADG